MGFMLTIQPAEQLQPGLVAVLSDPFRLRTQILEGFGNVVVTSTDGRRLSSNHLKYSQSANRISSDSSYTLVRGNDTQTGIGFISDPNLSEFRCLRACGGSGLVPLGRLPDR